jgi:hypothetical protein
MHGADTIFLPLLHQFRVAFLHLLLLVELDVDGAERDAHHAGHEGPRAANVAEKHGRRICAGRGEGRGDTERQRVSQQWPPIYND